MKTASILRAVLGLLLLWSPVQAQDQRNEQFYFPGAFNWQFLKQYPEGGRLFNAFDYGHAALYEKLLTKPADLGRELEHRQFDYLTTDLLVRPPRFAVAEEAIEPSYAKLAWRAKMMFDWAHVLHRQIYDIYADPRLTRAEQDRLIERVTDYYLSNRRYAFTTVPKSMALMDEQYFSQVFRREYPKFNGLIWAYHWLQVGLYEPLIEGRTPSEKKAGVQATIARFWTMLQDAPARFPKVMPMTSAIAPQFSAAHPRAAVIFDNLHMTHDIISDILAADTVPAAGKRDAIYAALDQMQDSTRDLMTIAEWQNMGELMGGIAIMGGAATGILPKSPAFGAEAPMMGMDHGAIHMGEGPKTDAPRRHDAPGAPMAEMHQMHHDMGHHVDSTMPDMREMHERLLADPVIRERMEADPTLRLLLRHMMEMMGRRDSLFMPLMMPDAPAPADTSAHQHRK